MLSKYKCFSLGSSNISIKKQQINRSEVFQCILQHQRTELLQSTSEKELIPVFIESSDNQFLVPLAFPTQKNLCPSCILLSNSISQLFTLGNDKMMNKKEKRKRTEMWTAAATKCRNSVSHHFKADNCAWKTQFVWHLSTSFCIFFIRTKSTTALPH